MRFEMIPISKIQIKNSFFEINFLPDLTALKDSIGRKGILQPIVVRESQIISGFRRVLCAKELKLKTIPAFVVEEALNDLELFERAVEENLFSRSFNLIEKALVLQKLKKEFHVSQDVIIEKYMPWLGLGPSSVVYKRYEELLGLEKDIQVYMVRENLSLYVLECFSIYSVSEQKLLSSFMSKVHFTVSSLKEFLMWVHEIRVRDNIELKEVLFSVQECSSYEEVKKALKLKRYPRLSELENKFKEFKQSLALPLEAPPFFEDNKIHMKLGFSNKTELEAWAQKIDQALDKKELEEMLKLL